MIEKSVPATAVSAEMIEVLTPDGASTGTVKTKREVHRDGDWHRAAHVWIVANDRVLLQRRALIKDSWPGLWDVSVAGHVSAGETPLEAAIREAREEIGLDIASADLAHLGTLRYHCRLRDDYVENEFHDVYLLRREVDPRALTLDPAEVMDVALVLPAELARYELVPHEEEYALLLHALA